MFIQKQSEAARPDEYRQIVDLTHLVNAHAPSFDPMEGSAFQIHPVATVEKDGYFVRSINLPEHYATHMDAPAHFISGSWTVDQIPPERLVAPLAVLDVRANVEGNPDYQVSVDDIVLWEKNHGTIPLNALVLAYTGWDTHWDSAQDYRNADANGVLHFPGYSVDAARSLVEERKIVGIGIDTLSVDPGPSQDFAVHHYTLVRNIYQLENVANLGLVPERGATVVVAPMKLEGGSGAPVRILALMR